MIKDIYSVSEQFESAVNKFAAKEKISRKKLVSALEKAKANYSKIKANLDSLEAQDRKIQVALEKARTDCNDSRRHMLKMHKAIQNMDLASASDAIFYDSEDIGYVIDSKEYHLDLNDSGEMVLVPMNKYRRDKKKEIKESEIEVAQDTSDEDDDQDFNDNDEGIEALDSELDELYAKLSY